MKIHGSQVTYIYIYEWAFRKGQVFSTQPYCMYILVNSGDLRIKLEFILYEDLRLIHYGEHYDQQSDRSIATT